ncbi:MAG TPA: radical SAM protein [Candidatus Limnocylindrales bacterium]|jgi:radical SAM protein with 4Fe4S-binding SPASM domain|nr:radical SAM protein [Candidatus Limnocylindrales bacterium]
MKSTFDIAKTPMTVVWEATQSCDPAYCYETGQPERDPLELNTKEAEKMIRDIAELKPPVFIIEGGDPLARNDIFSLICYAGSCGLHPALVLDASFALTRNVIAELKNSGLARLGLRVDGSTAELHDSITRHPKGFEHTRRAMQVANEWRLPLQIHTDLCRHNLNDLENIAALLKQHRVMLWIITFPVPDGKLLPEDVLTAEEFEQAFATIYKISQQVSFKIKTVEAQHYRRFVLQQRSQERADKLWNPAQDSFEANGIPGILPLNEGLATAYISNTGEVYPSACFPLSAGNVRVQPLKDVYREAELFRLFRETRRLTGKCGRCSFHDVCGGSRARALRAYGDMFQQDSCCAYEPPLRPEPKTV